MSLKDLLKTGVRRFGFDIARFSPESRPLARRQRLFETYGVDLLIDVGANSGQYAIEMRRELGYSGRIVSFEPLTSAFRELEANAAKDRSWRVFHCALGARHGKAAINIAGNSYSSSLLAMLPSHLRHSPESKYVDKEMIEVRTLDSLFNELSDGARSVYLKIDTQGFEAAVLAGATRSLPRIATIQLEMSLVPLYEGSMAFEDLFRLMREQGYVAVSLEPGFTNRQTGQLLQVDGIFHRLARHAASNECAEQLF